MPERSPQSTRAERIRTVSRWIIPVMIVAGLLWDLVPFITPQKHDTISYFVARWSSRGWLIFPAFCGALCGHWFAPTYWGPSGIRMAGAASLILIALAVSVWFHFRPIELPRWSPAVVCMLFFVIGSALWPNETLTGQ